MLHWAFVAGAAAFVIGGGLQFLTAHEEYSRTGGLAALFFGGGGFFITGRAIRYIFAAE